MALNNNNPTEIDLLLDGLENETDFSDIPVDAELLKLAEELTTPEVKPIEQFKFDWFTLRIGSVMWYYDAVRHVGMVYR